jgi:hypothetical protein
MIIHGDNYAKQFIISVVNLATDKINPVILTTCQARKVAPFDFELLPFESKCLVAVADALKLSYPRTTMSSRSDYRKLSLRRGRSIYRGKSPAFYLAKHGSLRVAEHLELDPTSQTPGVGNACNRNPMFVYGRV